MPQGAFLRAPSPDVAHLVQQVKSDPAVAIRYSRLFHLPVKMVPLAFEQLHLKNLAVDHVMQVHFVKSEASVRDKSVKEDLVYKMRRVRAGTPVYCLPDGTPLLVRVCGNPIRTRVSPEFYRSAPVPNFNPRERLQPLPTRDSSTAINTDTPRFAALPATPLPVITIVPATDVLPIALLPAAPALPPIALRAASLPPVYTWAHSPNGFFGLPALGLLSLLSTSRSGSNASAAPPVQPITPPPSKPSTPSTPGTPGTPGTPEVLVPPIPVTPPPVVNVPEPGILTFGLISLMGLSYACVRRRR